MNKKEKYYKILCFLCKYFGCFDGLLSVVQPHMIVQRHQQWRASHFMEERRER